MSNKPIFECLVVKHDGVISATNEKTTQSIKSINLNKSNRIILSSCIFLMSEQFVNQLSNVFTWMQILATIFFRVLGHL